jgi:hypothetical protein
MDGAEFDDKPPGVLPYVRSVNHFHNPLVSQIGAEGDVPEFLELLLLCDTIDGCHGQLASTLKVCFSM